MKQNKITPLDELRQEKAILKRECAEGENRLSDHWSYIRENAGSLLLSSAVNNVKKQFGFGSSSKEVVKSTSEKSESNGIFQALLGGAIAAYPLIWEMVQPMLMSFAIDKVKSIFTRKKKSKK